MLWRSTVLTACVTGSVALHLGVLLSAGSHAAVAASADSDRGGSRSKYRAMHVALHQRPPVRLTATPPATGARPAPVAASAPTTALHEDLDTLPPTGAGLPGTATTSTSESTPAGEAENDYLPRSRLTRGPVPQQSIDLFYPETAPAGRFRAVLTLFIDEQGVVQRVRFDEADDSGLPPVLEDAARQTFLHSSFAPGEIDGRPIRSRLRIEVEYATAPH